MNPRIINSKKKGIVPYLFLAIFILIIVSELSGYKSKNQISRN